MPLATRLALPAVFTVLLFACADDGGGSVDGDAATTTAAATTATSTTAEPQPAPTSAPATTEPANAVPTCADAVPTSHQQSAGCVYAALVAGDLTAAQSYATPEALELLAPLIDDADREAGTFDGCRDDPLIATPTSGIACTIYIPDQVHGVDVELAMRDDFVVEDVETIG